MEEPSVRFFFPERPKAGNYLAELRRKGGTHLVTLLFDAPGMIDDLLIPPQLERSARGGFERALSRERASGFWGGGTSGGKGKPSSCSNSTGGNGRGW